MFVSQIIDEVAEILATTDESKIFRKLTQAVQALMESGHYFHTQQEVDVCTGWDGVTITLPRGIEVPLGVNIDGSPTYFRNRLFQYHVNKGGVYNNVNWAWDDRGFVSTMMDIRQPSQLVAVAEHTDDAGIQLRVVGTDSQNRELRSQTTDGVGVDGIYIPVNAQSDFPMGTIIPPGVTIESRSVAVTPLGTLRNLNGPHGLRSGQKVVASIQLGGGLPSPLKEGQPYYVGVVSDTDLLLYNSSLDAKDGVNPIRFSSLVGAVSQMMTLKDVREVNLLTSVELDSPVGISIDPANSVSFWKNSGGLYSGQLPTPLEEGKTYFANQQDDRNIFIYNSIQDAQSGKGQVNLTGSSGKFDVDVKKPAFAQTTIEFPVKHYYQQGDSVQAYTSGGVLPSPLLEGQNYFVNVIDGNTISLHLTAADAAASAGGLLQNPIVLTDPGTGTNSLVKLIPATFSTGSSNQVSAPGLSFETIEPEFSAVAQPVVVGSVTGIVMASAAPGGKNGSKYTSAPAVIFDPPPPPPEGSNQIVVTATGYAVMELDAVGSTTFAVGSIVITNPGSGYTSAPSISIDPPPTGGVQAAATAQITTSSISYFNVVSSGAGYASAPQVTITGGGGSGATASASIDSAGRVKSVNVISQGTGYTSASGITVKFTPSSGVFIQFSSTGSVPSPISPGVAYRAENRSADGTFTVENADFSSVNVTDSGTGNVSVVLSRSFYVGLNARWNGDFGGIASGSPVYLSSDYILPSGTSSGVPYYLRKIGSDNKTSELYLDSASATASDVQATSVSMGYQSSSVATISFGYKTSRVVTMSVSGTTVTIAPTSGSTFDTSDFRVGSYIEVTATGSATNTEGVFVVTSISPTQLQYKTSATAGPSTGTITVFGGGAIATLSGSFDTSFFKAGSLVNVSSSVSPQTNAALGLFVISSATSTQIQYSVPVGTSAPTGTLTAGGGGQVCQLIGVFSSSLYSVGDTIIVSSAASQINGALGFFKIVSNSGTLLKYLVPTGTASPSGTISVRSRIIVPSALGVGQSYIAVRIPAYAKAFDNQIAIDSLEYLEDGDVVTFSSTGSVPAPLNPIGVYDYYIYKFGNNIKITQGTPGSYIEFKTYPGNIPTLAVGQMSMTRGTNVWVVKSDTISSKSNLFETGTQVTVRPSVGDSLPDGLVEPTPSAPSYYYLRRVDSDRFEMYPTLAQAKSGTTGKILFQNTGDSVDSTFFVDGILPPTLVKSIIHVDKPITKGYVSLYALDYGRSNDMCLIGQYHPSETNPKYRRIRVGKPCAWARIIYRVKAPSITSVYDYIPIENERALIAAVHAIDLEDKDFIDQSQKYFALAFAYLKNQSESMDGHAMSAPQINNITYGDGTDPVMF